MIVSLKKIILKNTAWLTISRILNSLIGYILIVAIARNLGDIGLGQYSFIFAFAGLTFIGSDFGLNYLLVKEVSRNTKKSQYYFEIVFSIKIILALFSLLLTFIISLFLNKDPLLIKSLWIVSLIQFSNVFSGLFTNFFSSFNMMHLDAISSFIERLVALILGLYVLYNNASLILLVFAFLISNFVRLFYLAIKMKSKIKFKFTFDYMVWIKFLKEGIPYFLAGVFIFIYFRIDTIMISFMKGDEVTGWYNSAYRLIDILNIIPSILIVSITPIMSKLFKTDKKLLGILFMRLFRYLLMLAIPIAIGTIILAERFINFIYGASFIGGTISLQILIWAEVFIFVNYLMGILLNSIDKQKYFTIITGTCAMFNILLNLILIPPFSYIGAGVATVITEALNFILLKRYVQKFAVKIKFTLSMFKSFIASIIMGVIIYNLSFLAIWYVVPIGIVIYGVSLLIMRLEKEDKELIRQTINYLENKIKNVRV